ncbi:hypothetical protein SAMN05519103_07681 [Rhizobiales bacterium GAS113]|nr:hypothetical protein SAMN05519103_07681 [Rhizobiales bacterium GAS113]
MPGRRKSHKIAARDPDRNTSLAAFWLAAFCALVVTPICLFALFATNEGTEAMAATQARSFEAQSFTVTSPGLADGALLTRRHAASAGDCGGENVSPALAWSPSPEGTRSHAVIVYDPDGGKGLGSVHWVAYDLPASRSSLAEGEGTAAPGAFVGGTNTRGLTAYSGPCPPIGDQPHHYVFGVYALDIEPGSLAPGLTRDKLLEAMRGHVLAASSIVLRYAR